MLKNTLPVIIALTIILCATSCYKKGSTGPTGPAGPAGPAYKGVINGHISLYDQYGSKLFSGYNDIQLTLTGGKTVTPDSTGYYIFDSVTTGTYNITASGTGLATTMLTNLQFINDTLYRDIKLSDVPSFSLSSFIALHNAGSGYDSLIITMPSDTRARNCIVFVSNKASVSNLPANYLYNYVKAIAANATQVVIRVLASDLNYAGIFYGEPVYYAAYSYVVNDVSVYEDMVTGNSVYNAVSSPMVDSTTSP